VPQVSNIKGKPVFISIPFRGNRVADRANGTLHQNLQRIFPAATRPLLFENLKDKVFVHDNYTVVAVRQSTLVKVSVQKSTGTLPA